MADGKLDNSADLSAKELCKDLKDKKPTEEMEKGGAANGKNVDENKSEVEDEDEDEEEDLEGAEDDEDDEDVDEPTEKRAADEDEYEDVQTKKQKTVK